MLDLKLREEFRGKKLKGTMVDFTNRQGTGALDKSAEEFLRITYPSVDLLKLIEALQPGKAHPAVIIGSRGQGKSHLMAALAHMYSDPDATESWLHSWANQLHRDELKTLSLNRDVEVITESLHQHNYTFLWDVLFDKHPEGQFIKGKWEGQGEDKTEVPGMAYFIEMFQKKPTVLILDEFQTWYEGLTNTKQYPRRNWAFNFIQILSEIAEENPELLTLVLSVREGSSDAAQQVYRINPVRIDFKGPEAARDRQKLLLYRIFENRIQIPDSDIENLIQPHLIEYYRLNHVPGSEQERHKGDFLNNWPFSPLLMKLLDDQVLIATETQETRDLLRILVDVFKSAGASSPVLTAADFSIVEEKSGVASLLDSVANQLHRDLRTKALRNYEAVKEAMEGTSQSVPNLAAILSSLWIRSLSLEKIAGARSADIQLDITRSKAVDDNLFSVEMETIKENSFNIHQKGDRLVFLNEENPQAKLMAHAKNDKLFNQGQDIDYLAQEIRYIFEGSGSNSSLGRVIVLKKSWQIDPWNDVGEKERPENWDNRIPYVVIPRGDVKNKDLGQWLNKNVSKNRNTIRFILAKDGLEQVFYDKALLVLTRAVYLAKQWKSEDPNYSALHVKYQKELRSQLSGRFDRYAVLDTWNFGTPANCIFEINTHKAEGDRIIPTVHDKVKRDLFLVEDFEYLVLDAAKRNDSVAGVLNQLKEPMGGENPCIPWLGEIETKEEIIRFCARGKIEINLCGKEMLSSRPGESEDAAWNRMKGKIGTGRTLEETYIHEPDSTVSPGGGKVKDDEEGSGSAEYDKPDPGQTETKTNEDQPAGDEASPSDLFGGGKSKPVTSFNSGKSTPLSLYGKIVDSWGITAGVKVPKVTISLEDLTGAQLQQLVKNLPDGFSYSLDVEKGGVMQRSNLDTIMNGSPGEAWQQILDDVWTIFAGPINPVKADALITERDKKAGELDTLLSGAAWDLWHKVDNAKFLTSTMLREFWQQNPKGKAVLILDGLSLRESCWILEQAKQRGYQINRQQASIAETPADTTTFAKALGFSQRSSLADNKGKSTLFPEAFTESVDMPFTDCSNLLKPETSIFFWHHWPDSKVHELADDGSGGQKLTRTATELLTSDDFWNFIERLATGRKLVITGDHGYANAGLFRDIADKEQSSYMKKLFKSGRVTTNVGEDKHTWVPPLTIESDGNAMVLGRRKWKSQGGYPTLTHGGLSLLEMIVPFIEIEKQ